MYKVGKTIHNIEQFFSDLTNSENNAKDALAFFDQKLFNDFYNRPSVYFLAKDGKIVYIGETKQIAARIHQHFRSKKDFDSFYFCFTSTQKEAERLESMLIQHYMPKLNVQIGHLDIAKDMGINQALFKKMYLD
jgi:ERCC4-related helicase